jgi:hypothetical protein
MVRAGAHTLIDSRRRCFHIELVVRAALGAQEPNRSSCTQHLLEPFVISPWMRKGSVGGVAVSSGSEALEVVVVRLGPTEGVAAARGVHAPEPSLQATPK